MYFHQLRAEYDVRYKKWNELGYNNLLYLWSVKNIAELYVLPTLMGTVSLKYLDTTVDVFYNKLVYVYKSVLKKNVFLNTNIQP